MHNKSCVQKNVRKYYSVAGGIRKCWENIYFGNIACSQKLRIHDASPCIHNSTHRDFDIGLKSHCFLSFNMNALQHSRILLRLWKASYNPFNLLPFSYARLGKSNMKSHSGSQ